MAEEMAIENAEINPKQVEPTVEDMSVVESPEANVAKRAREEEENDEVLKKQKVDKSVEEERLEKLEGEGEGEGEGDGDGEEKEKKDQLGAVSLGPKNFESAVEMFDYFYNFLHFWPPNLNVNKYEHMVLLELLKKGHSDPEKKIGDGIQCFQVRIHPMWKSRCFFLIRDDNSVDDFSFRKCVDKILPLPEDMKIKSDTNKFSGGGKGYGGRGGGAGRGGRGHGRSHGRGGKSRN